MLTADLVNARRRGDELLVTPLDAEKRATASDLAERLVAMFADSVGRQRDEVLSEIGEVTVLAREQRLKDGLVKLLDDRCTWGAEGALDPELVRRELFQRATAKRRALGAGERFDRAALVIEVAGEFGASSDALETALFADLRGANVLSHFDPITPAMLVEAYEKGQTQAVLLRATRVVVLVECSTAHAARALFRRLKFLGLLHSIVPHEAKGQGYQITIDGPMSLFESVTKYGVKMAQLLPVLEHCDSWSLSADIRWGKERRALKFHASSERRGRGAKALAGRATHAVATACDEGAREGDLPDDLAALVRALGQLDTEWKVSLAHTVLDLPGTGLSVPDLVFRRGKLTVYFEAMGYWSREAVFRRVDLVTRGLSEKIVFAVSSRLRVSEEVLDEDASGALYVYKGTMSARALIAHVDRLSQR